MKVLAYSTVFALCILWGGCSGDEVYNVRDHYVKTEHMIPMRDGVKLFTIVYSPRDQSEQYPFLIERTAYGIHPYGPDEYEERLGRGEAMAREGFIFVSQDVRGKFKSEGEFVHHVPYRKDKGPTEADESSDTYDTIEWLINNIPNNNGKAALWGTSWVGWQTSQGMLDAHPALKAASPQAPPQDQFLGDDHHSNGAFQLMYAFSWMMRSGRARAGGPTEQRAEPFDYGTKDGYKFFLQMGALGNANTVYFKDQSPTWNDYAKHGTYDEYWQSRNVPKDLKNIGFPVLIVLDWFDAQDFYGPLRMYYAIEKFNPANQTTIVAGPWQHGGHGRGAGDRLYNIYFGTKTSAFYRDSVELPFFKEFLKGKGKASLPEALMFETGGNRWRSFDRWPPQEAEQASLYLRSDGALSWSRPQESSQGAFDTYVSDPSFPVPFTADTTTTEGHAFMVEDQRFVAGRPDVLVYTSEVLEQDVTVAGPLVASLYVSTTGTDGDWVAKLIDVYPDDYANPDPGPDAKDMRGYQMLLAGDIMRAKFRKVIARVARLTRDAEYPQMGPDRRKLAETHPMVPGEVTHLEFDLGDKLHTFRKGHRIMVQIQSTWFPMFDRNPQKFVNIYTAKQEDYQKATIRVYRSSRYPSHIKVHLLSDQADPDKR